jgi:hypothetical protein
MIAFAYNDNRGGVLEYELRMANSTEVQLGLKYVARGGYRFISASVLSTGAYSPDGLTLLYLDQMSPSLQIWSHNSFVTAANMIPWGAVELNPSGAPVWFAGYGPKKKLLFATFPWKGVYLAPGAKWRLYLGTKLLTETQGYSPVYAPDLGRIFFVQAGEGEGAGETIRSTDEAGGSEAVVGQFKGGWVRSLAITQNRSVSKWEPLAIGEELIVSVYFPNEGQSAVFTGSNSGFTTKFKKRFTVPSDWVMVAGTGVFGDGTRVMFTSGQDLRIWDNRDGSVNDIREWKTDDGINHYHYAIPTFRHFVQGSGLAISPEARRKTKKRKKAAKGDQAE